MKPAEDCYTKAAPHGQALPSDRYHRQHPGEAASSHDEQWALVQPGQQGCKPWVRSLGLLPQGLQWRREQREDPEMLFAEDQGMRLAGDRGRLACYLSGLECDSRVI
jgi:hypothetical protein